MLFLSKLDPLRYAAMLAQLTNDATLGRAFPPTLHAARSVSSGWKTANVKTSGSSDLQSVFVLADDFTAGPTSSKSATSGQQTKQAGRFTPGNKKQPLQSTIAQPARKPSNVTTAETRTCRGCLVKGHIYRNCPDNPQCSPTPETKVMIARGEDDAADEDIFNSPPTFIINETSSQESSSISFMATGVLLDNQAGLSCHVIVSHILLHSAISCHLNSSHRSRLQLCSRPFHRNLTVIAASSFIALNFMFYIISTNLFAPIIC